MRSAVVWAGLPDPGETRLLLQESADITAESMGVLLSAWECMDPEQSGLTSAEVIERLKSPPSPAPDWYADLRDAVEALVGRLDARALGTRLRSYRRRVFAGRFLDQAGGRTGRRVGSCTRPTPSDLGANTLPTLVTLTQPGWMGQAGRAARGSVTSVGSVFHPWPAMPRTLTTTGERRTPLSETRDGGRSLRSGPGQRLALRTCHVRACVVLLWGEGEEMPA